MFTTEMLRRNCIVIMTTSVGQSGALATDAEDAEHRYFVQAIQAHFPVEFLSRIDELIIFVSTYL